MEKITVPNKTRAAHVRQSVSLENQENRHMVYAMLAAAKQVRLLDPEVLPCADRVEVRFPDLLRSGF